VYGSKSASVNGVGYTKAISNCETLIMYREQGPDEAVRKFLTSPVSTHPLLVICYEMFRPFAAAINTATNVEVLVCDEGHR
jgi:hypothetical protein